jgi:hypothetical protein
MPCRPRNVTRGAGYLEQLATEAGQPTFPVVLEVRRSIHASTGGVTMAVSSDMATMMA